MNFEQAPPRLRYGSEFGDLIARAAKHEISAAQIVATGEAINGGIAVTTTGLTVLGGKAATKWLVVSALTVGGVVGGLVYSNQSSGDSHEIPTVPTETKEPDAAPPPTPVVKRIELPPPRRVPIAGKPQPPRISLLAEQVRLFEQAQVLAKNGDHGKALGVLEQLLERFPDSHLRPDVGLLRVSCLLAENQLDAAHAEIERLLAGEIPIGKKAQLLQLSGDIWMRNGNCPRAVMAYRRALGLGLPNDNMESAQSGIRKCLQKD